MSIKTEKRKAKPAKGGPPSKGGPHGKGGASSSKAKGKTQPSEDEEEDWEE